MIVDLHVDAGTEDGLADPSALVGQAKAAGLDGLLLTHGDDFEFDVAPYRAEAEPEGLTVFRGARLDTDHGLLLCVLPSDAEVAEGWIEALDGVYDAHGVIEAVEERGGVTVALRPYDRDVAHPMGDHLFVLQGLAACEVNNGSLSEIANDLALEAASNMEMPCVGSSGSQGGEGLGTAATLFREAVADESALCDALRAGDCWPLTFSDTAPRGEESGKSRGGRGRGDRDDRDGNRRGRRGGRGGGGGGGGGGDAEGKRKRRRGGRGRGSGGSGGGGGGGGGRRPDDVGNRAPREKGHVPEDVGNRVRSEREENLPPEDVGNRRKPGEVSLYHKVAYGLDDDDEGRGNR